MRKKYLLVLGALIIVIILLVYSSVQIVPVTPSDNLTESQNQENKAPSFKFQFRFPWQTETSSTSTSGAAGSGSSGSSEGGGSSGGGGVVNQTQNYTQKVNYTLDIQSLPSGIGVIPFYYLNNVLQNETYVTPFSLYIESGTKICLAEATNYTGFIWKVDDSRCTFSFCYGYRNGCDIIVDRYYNITLVQES